MSEERKEPTPEDLARAEDWLNQAYGACIAPQGTHDQPCGCGDNTVLARLITEAERRATRSAVEECCRLTCGWCKQPNLRGPAVRTAIGITWWHGAHQSCHASPIREHFREVLGSENVVSSKEG